MIIAILLALALGAVTTFLVISLGRLQEARDVIDEQNQIIDQKEVFSSAMSELVAAQAQFTGVPYSDLVDVASFQRLADSGYQNRRDLTALASDIADVRAATQELNDLWAGAQTQLAANASGTVYESVIDALGGGFVTSAFDDADGLCQSDVLGCVTSDDPRTVHFDANDISLPYMTDFIQTGIAYHEFAHVLQFTNVTQTEDAVAAFGGDSEIMADCFALTYLDGWTLQHTVPDANGVWEVDIGYGYTCDESQRQVIRDWYTTVPFQPAPIAQR